MFVYWENDSKNASGTVYVKHKLQTRSVFLEMAMAKLMKICVFG